MSDKNWGTTVLVGDVGGTRTRLALYARDAEAPLAETIVPSGDHEGLEPIVQSFLAEQGGAAPYAAVFGVAGPVRNGTASITNLPWKLDERALERRIGIPRVALANDLVVGARGCLEVGPADIELLTGSAPARKGEHIGVIAAGTGLGEARLVWASGRYHALPTEGGHTDFAPRSPLEVELWQFLAARHPDHVSYERVVSGAGLGAIHDFFSAREDEAPNAHIAARLAQGDRNAVIAELGLARAHRPAALAVDLFARIYGAEAGNIALRELALGGIYVIGNIGNIIIPARREIFLEGFLDKGRFRDLLATIPIAVVRDPLVGVRGARALAEELAQV
ncbi:Glucokinase [Minicystis rosea]|nr:Glucokinase [Minicystis rosea]